MSKELDEELMMYKKEAVEQHEKGFHKVNRQAGFFAKDLDLGLFYPFKEMKDGILLDEEDLDLGLLLVVVRMSHRDMSQIFDGVGTKTLA